MFKKMMIAGTLAATAFGGIGISGAGATELPTIYNKNIAIESVNHNFYLEEFDTYIIEGQEDFPNYLRSFSISTDPEQYVYIELWDDLGMVKEDVLKGNQFVNIAQKPREGTFKLKIYNLSPWGQEIYVSTMGY